MKVIDLLNDLFEYRELQPDKLPKKIRFNNEEFVFKNNSYYHENGINIMRYVDHTLDLRVEVEIIEEQPKKEGFVINNYRFVQNENGVSVFPIEEDKEIEEAKIKTFEDTGEAVTILRVHEYNDLNFKELKRVTDELIKAVNE